MRPRENKKSTSHPYTMKIERTIVDKLGLQMYDKASAVVAELIANSYDADAEDVVVKIPLGKALAVQKDGVVEQKDYIIEVQDNGHGMTPEEAREFYLKVGIDRRKNPGQGSKSREKKRDVMGHKGIGKLAPFGICHTIEVRSAGGEKTQKGYQVAHFELDYDKIIGQTESKSDEDYHPTPLSDDETFDKKRGTRVILKNFNVKLVPGDKTFQRQLAARFGLELPDFRITVIDIKHDKPVPPFQVGRLHIPLMKGTKIIVDNRPVKVDEREYAVTGWVGMAKHPYQNVEMAGIRIYARGKIVSGTRDFGIPSGFAGEYVARSYLVGEIHADWLDDEEDLIQTHRQDILWSSDLGVALATWGQKLVKEVAKRGREPRREKVKSLFMEVSQLREKAKHRFPDSELQETAIEVGAKIGQFASEEELTDQDYVDDLSELILTIAPHKLLIDTFKKINEMAIDGKVAVVDLLKLFKTTEIAHLASYGQIVAEKLKTIDVFKATIRQPDTSESELQQILERAPWLINPRWELTAANLTLKRFQEAFESWYKKTSGEEITTSTRIRHETKKPDFIFLHRENKIIVVEIKPPKHTFDDTDWERLQRYHDAILAFLEKNRTFKDLFPYGHQVILVRDSEKVSPTVEKALTSLVDKEYLVKYTWEELLDNAERDHESFLTARDILGSP
jgi:hypothetical protein